MGGQRRTFGALLARESAPPRGLVLAVLGQVAVSLDAGHRRGHPHGGVAAERIELALEQGRVRATLAPATPTSAASFDEDRRAVGALLARALHDHLDPSSRRDLVAGLDPLTSLPAPDAHSLVRAARRESTPLPGPPRDPSTFWDEPPDPDRRRRRPRPRLLVAGGLAALTAAAVTLWAGRSPGSAPPPPSPLDEVAVETDFDTATDLLAAYRRDAPPGLESATAFSGPPACAEGVVEERAWTMSSGALGGRYRCEWDSGGARIVWTEVDAVTGARRLLRLEGGDLAALFEQWRGLAPAGRPAATRVSPRS